MKNYKTFLELPNLCGIYRISDSESEKFYIGSAISIKKRIGNHIYNLKNNIHHNPRLQALWNKNKERFRFEVLEIIEIPEKSIILTTEQKHLNLAQVGKNPNCMNFLIIANSHQGIKRSPESIEKLRKANLGKKRTEEAKQKMRLAKLGKKLSEEHKKKIGRSGEKNNKTKITESQAKDIKYSGLPLKLMAQKYGMSLSGVEKIRYGTSWKYI